MTVGIACPECRYLIGVADNNIEITSPVSDVAGSGVLLAVAACPECRTIYSAGEVVDVIIPVLVEGGKRRVNVS